MNVDSTAPLRRRRPGAIAAATLTAAALALGGTLVAMPAPAAVTNARLPFILSMIVSVLGFS